jgi:hypothetical protein
MLRYLMLRYLMLRYLDPDASILRCFDASMLGPSTRWFSSTIAVLVVLVVLVVSVVVVVVHIDVFHFFVFRKSPVRRGTRHAFLAAQSINGLVVPYRTVRIVDPPSLCVPFWTHGARRRSSFDTTSRPVGKSGGKKIEIWAFLGQTVDERYVTSMSSMTFLKSAV